MGGISEREFKEKIHKVRERSSKTTNEIKNDFTKMEKLKAETLKRTEEMRHFSEQDLDKLDREITKENDLAPESRQRLIVELSSAKNDVQQKYAELKGRIQKAIVPE